MEGCGYKYIQKLQHFIAKMNSGNKRSKDMKHNRVKNCDFMSILYSESLREYKKRRCSIGERVLFSKFNSLFRNGYQQQFTHRNFQNFPIATQKPPKFTNNNQKGEDTRGRFKVLTGKFLEKLMIWDIWV